MSLTPELLKYMDTGHALAALRLELAPDMAWLPDWIESLLPDKSAEDIIAAAENYQLDAKDINALGEAYFGSVPYSCSLLTVLQSYEETLPTAERLREILEADIARLQAKIDALMLEYCPDEMTPQQIANYESHQKAVPNV